MNLLKKLIRASIGPLSILIAAAILMSDFGGASAGGLKRFLLAGAVVIFGCLLSWTEFMGLKKVIKHPVNAIQDMLRKYEK